MGGYIVCLLCHLGIWDEDKVIEVNKGSQADSLQFATRDLGPEAKAVRTGSHLTGKSTQHFSFSS